MSFCHGLKSQFDSLTAEPKPPIIIQKRHFRTSYEGTLSCFIESITVLKAHWIMFSRVDYYERETRWVSVITCIWYSIHSSAQSHIHNITLVWMSAEESGHTMVAERAQRTANEKTHANRKSTSKLRKHHQFDNTCAANTLEHVLSNWWRHFLNLLVLFLFACVFLSCSALSSLGHHS